MKGKEAPTSGSVKIDPEVYKELWEYCEEKGLKITRLSTEAIRDKLTALKDQEKNNA